MIMKKILVILTAATIAAAANAQVYVGGSLGVNYNTSNRVKSPAAEAFGSGSTTKTTNTTLTFTPTIGYLINDKWSVGLDLNLEWKKNTDDRLPGGAVTSDTQSRNVLGWDVRPFVRYTIFKIKKFGIDAKLAGGVGGSRETILAGKSDDASVINYLNYGVLLSPVLTFDINEHFSLESSLGIASIGWEGFKYTAENYSYDSQTENYFTFGLSNKTAISFGCIYKF